MTKLKKLSGILFFVLGLFWSVQAQSGMNWTFAPTLLSPRDSAAAVNSGGNIFVLGGNTNSPLSVDTLANGAFGWNAASPLLTGRIAPSAFAGPNGLIFVFGGKVGTKATKDAFYYNPPGGGFNLSSMKTPRYRFAAVSAGVNFYAIGGLTGGDVPTAAAEVFVTGINKWQPIISLPEARSNFSAASENLPFSASIMTFGGSIAGSAATNTVYRLDFFNQASWTTLAPMPIATRDSAVVLGANRLVYVIGGFSAAGTPVNTVQIYDIAANSWSVGAPLPVAVGAASAAIDNNGKLLVIGGVDATNGSQAMVYTSSQADAAPVFTSLPSPFIPSIAGQAYSYQAHANGNPAPTYSLVSNPAGMTIDSVNGLISWTPDLTQVGANSVTVRASNSSGDTDQTFTVNVAPPAPTGLAVSNITANAATLNWNPLPANAGAVSYNVYRRVCSGRGSCGYIPLASNLTTTTTTINGLVSGGGYGIVVTAVVNGFESPFTALVFFNTLQPAAPTNVVIAGITQNSVSLSWTAPATSPVPVVAYRIIENGLVIADNITGTSATIGGLLSNSTHIFVVVSLDANFNVSFGAVSPVVLTSSLPSLVHNSMFPRLAVFGGGFYPENLVAVNGGRLMLVSADAHSTAPVDYVVNSNGIPTATFSMVSGPAGMTIDAVSGFVSWTNVNSPNGTFTATVRGTNNVGATDFTFSYTVFAAGTDLLSPTEPLQLVNSVGNITGTSATITLAASTDNVGVAGYRIFIITPPPPCGRGGCTPTPTNIAPIAVVDGATTSVTLPNLTRGTAYGVWVQTFDAAGNTSFLTPGRIIPFTTLP